MASAPLVVLSCGEASGDLYASKVARALQQQRPDLRLAGIAGPFSRAAGVEVWAEQESLSIMGFVEVVRHYPRLRRIARALVTRAAAEHAALFLPVDYPGFHIRVAGMMHEHSIPVLDFIPPKTWSWGRHRLKALRRNVEGAAVIFPFEEAHYRAAGVPATFVGHPLADLHAAALDAPPVERSGLLLAPGSRRQELLRTVPVLAQAVELMRRQGKLPAVTVSQAPGVDPQLLAPLVAAGAELVTGELFGALRRAQAAIVCSGTATVEAALAGAPHLIIYRTGALTYAIARRVASVEHIGMANIILDRRAYPELLQGELDATAVVREILPLLEPGSPAARAQAAAGQELRAALGGPGCFDRVAAMAVAMLAERGL